MPRAPLPFLPLGPPQSAGGKVPSGYLCSKGTT